MLFDDFFNKSIHKAQPGWRRVSAQAIKWGIPTPAISASIAFFDEYRSEVVSANILQAQVRVSYVLSDEFPAFTGFHLKRDYFGARTFEVRPWCENARLKAGEAIRTSFYPTPHIYFPYIF